MSEKNVRVEEFKVQGDKLLAKGKELLHAGNVRRIIIKNQAGKTLVNIPLTAGVVGLVLAPQLIFLGAIVALLTDGSIVVEKTAEMETEAVEEMLDEVF